MSGTSMAAPAVSGAIALMLEANPSLSPKLVKAILEYTAETKADISPLAQGAGFLNTLGAVKLSRYFATHDDANYPKSALWGRTIIWGNRQVKGGTLAESASAWGDNIVWGTIADGDNIVWGTAAADGDNIVWGTITDYGDNIVWGTASDGGDNIVWGTDCGGADCGDNIVWGTAAEGDNIVWGTAADGDNIVWGTAADGDNIVWGTAADGDNIVWGTSDLNEVFGTADPVEAADIMFDNLFAPPPPPVVTDGTIGGGL
jgi:hypothetical protein